MGTHLSIHGVDRIEVSAETSPSDDGRTYFWQTLRFLDHQGVEIGQVVAFLDRPEVALPVGDQPPYWGFDLAKPAALLADGDAPF